MADDDRTSFNTGFAIGFLASFALCSVYWCMLVSEQKGTFLAPVEVYKFMAPKLESEAEDSVSDILKYGVPDRGPQTLSYLNHVVGYDQARKIPSWVAERITRDHIKGDSDRDKCHFKPDSDKVEDTFSPDLDDYRHSGYDRGHMSPAANHKYSQDAMCDSFYLTNVVPQDSQHNRRYWQDVEHYCRDLAGRYEEVRAITGPLFLPETPVGSGETGESKRFVRYEVIGENNVTVPTHLFKVIAVENSTASFNTTLFVAAFIFPNKPLDSLAPLVSFQVPLAQLEAVAGHRFFPLLAGAPVGNLCAMDPCRLRGESTGFELATMGSLSSGILCTVTVLVWVYIMYKWREQVDKVNKK